jgi:hypothetical protein
LRTDFTTPPNPALQRTRPSHPGGPPASRTPGRGAGGVRPLHTAMSHQPTMNKYRAIILMFVCHVLGVGLGVGMTHLYYSFWADKMISNSAAASLSTKVVVLNRLRTGNTNSAIEVMETLVDGDLISLQATVGQQSPNKRDPDHIKLLQRAREYRSKYPHTNSYSEVDLTVSNALRIPEQIQ